ncbi:unnamed protein product, partial [Mesorhabditis spiculigera]
MDLPIDVQHRILEKLPLKTLFQIRSLHSTFDNYFRFHCKKWRCSSLAIYRLIEQDSTLFQLDDWAIGQKHFEMCRLLTVHLMTISGPGITWMELPIDLGKFGALAQAGGVRARIMQITAANIDEKSREMIRNVHPKVLHINKVFISEETWLSIPPSCEKVVIGTYYNPYIDLTEATGLKEISINQKKAEKLTSETVTEMDLPIDVQHRILEKVPLRTLFQIRSLHSTFNNYLRFHCKSLRCSSLAIYRLNKRSPTALQLDGRVITQPQLAKLRHLDVELLTITILDRPRTYTVDLGELGILGETGRLRARVVQVWPAKMDEGIREFIRNIHPKVLHIDDVLISADNSLAIPSSCEKEILNKIREGVATRQMVDGMIEELNSGEPGRLWHYRETDDRHYLCHTHVSFFITKLPTANQ